jgi:hypothetical protein
MKSSKYIVITKNAALLFLSIFMLAGCKPKLLPSTNVPATRENKKIVAFLEQYKSAIEKRSVEAVMELVAKDFKDSVGSTGQPEDYLDFLKLKERLDALLPLIKDIRLSMFVQHIRKIEKDIYEVVFYFNKYILTDVPAGEKWISIKEVSRMILRQRHDKDSPYEFEIMQGI